MAVKGDNLTPRCQEAEVAEKVRLGDVCTPLKGEQINGSELSDKFGYPFLNGGVEPSGKWRDYNVSGGTVTVSEGGNSCGFVNYMEDDFWCGAHCYYLSNPRCDSKYLFHSLKAKQKEIQALRTGVCMPNIKKSVISNFAIKYHCEVEIQRRIAGELDKICELKKNAETRLEKLNLLVKSRFVEMFGDPMMNPMGWPLVAFDSICENLDGRRVPISSAERKYGIYPYYGASGIVDYIDDYIFDEDILLISEDGANLKMRSTPIAFSVSGKCWVNNHAHVVRFSEKATQVYIEHLIELTNIDGLLTGSTQPKLNQAKLNGMFVQFPPLALQREFAAFVERVDKLKDVAKKSVEQMDVLYRSKLQEYFG